MFSFLKRADRGGARIGVCVTADAVFVAQISAGTGGRPKLDYCRYGRGERDAVLAELAHTLPRRRAPAVDVLAPGSYHLLLVEAPDVPVDELRAAVRWRIKDLIDFHVDDAVIDVFEMPAQGRGGINKMMYAVAARAEVVRTQIDAVEGAGLKLGVVDIAELSLRNVAERLEPANEGIALLYVSDAHSILLIVRQGVLYLTRRVETGLETLGSSAELRSELVEGLALETRRSLDYFESHYEQNPIGSLYTAGLDPSDQALLNEHLGLTVNNLDLASVLDCEAAIDADVQHECLPAIGAALREDRVTL